MPTIAQLKNNRLLWPCIVIVTLAISSSSGQPGVSSSMLIPLDKVAHFLVFGLLGTLFCRLPEAEADRLAPRTGLWAFGLAVLVGVCDELLQATNPERYADVADLAMDTIGAALAVLLYQKWRGYRRLLEAGG